MDILLLDRLLDRLLNRLLERLLEWLLDCWNASGLISGTEGYRKLIVTDNPEFRISCLLKKKSSRLKITRRRRYRAEEVRRKQT